ncbi:MAG: flagellin [Phycisphaerae bacterium]|nr:flagellin [Phycisphaerae bacterium]MBN8597337.1 flagellin [Planctomycetota bacterium]
MGRINTNVQSLIAQRVLGQNQQSLSSSLQRLSTGLRINSGKDDPAGLIASNNLGAEIASKNAAVANANRADQVVNIAAGGLSEVSGLLTQLQGLITATSSSAGISDAERSANQLQIDSILQTIDRISTSTSFQGIKLLNGNFDFKTSGVAAGVADYKINAAKFQGSANVDVLVTGSAQQGGMFLSFGAASIDTGTGSQFTIEVGGASGSRQLTFSSSTSLTNIAAAINSFTSITGVNASVSSTGIKLSASDFGSANFVSLRVVDAGSVGSGGNIGVYDLVSNNTNASAGTRRNSFDQVTNTITNKGKDMQATINGVAAITNGKTARINTDFLDVETTLTTGQSQTLGAVGSHAFSIIGGGATFTLAGNVDISGKVAIGIQSVGTTALGNSVVGYLSELSSGQSSNVVKGSTETAQKIVGAAIEQISSLSGRLGAFQSNTVGATIRSLGVAVENATAAQSIIRDADFAAETAGLTRSQILVNASTNVLGLANQAPQSVLQLLG